MSDESFSVRNAFVNFIGSIYKLLGHPLSPGRLALFLLFFIIGVITTFVVISNDGNVFDKVELIVLIFVALTVLWGVL